MVQVVCICHEGLADALVGADWSRVKSRGRGAKGEGDDDSEFYVDEHGDLVEVKEAEDEMGTRASVGDTAAWGAAYSLGELENAR